MKTVWLICIEVAEYRLPYKEFATKEEALQNNEGAFVNQTVTPNGGRMIQRVVQISSRRDFDMYFVNWKNLGTAEEYFASIQKKFS